MKYTYPKRSEQFVELEDNSTVDLHLIDGIPIHEIMANPELRDKLEATQLALAGERQRLHLLATRPKVHDAEPQP